MEEIAHDQESPYEGLEVVPAPTHEVEYSPPYFYQSSPQYEEEDAAFETMLQQEVDMVIYNSDTTEMSQHEGDSICYDPEAGYVEEVELDESFIQLDDVDAQIEAAFDEADQNWDYNNIIYNNTGPNGYNAAVDNNIMAIHASAADDNEAMAIHVDNANGDDNALAIHNDDLVIDVQGAEEDDEPEIQVESADDPRFASLFIQ